MAQTDAERLAEIEQQCVILSNHLDYLETDEPEVRTVAAIRAARLVVSALTQLLQRVRELEADRARLDWIEARQYCATCWNVGLKPDNGWTIDDDELGDRARGPTLRDAIDAARARESEPARARTEGEEG